MSAPAWTPGPWQQWNSHAKRVVTTIRGADRGVICTLAEHGDDWANAHARLITAAPDLYEALREEASLLRAWARESREGGWSTHQVDPMLRRADALDRLLAKARGEVLP